MKILNISPLGEIDLPLVRRVLEAGEVFEVPDDIGARLLEQSANFAAVTPAKKDKE